MKNQVGQLRLLKHRAYEHAKIHSNEHFLSYVIHVFPEQHGTIKGEIGYNKLQNFPQN